MELAIFFLPFKKNKKIRFCTKAVQLLSFLSPGSGFWCVLWETPFPLSCSEILFLLAQPFYWLFAHQRMRRSPFEEYWQRQREKNLPSFYSCLPFFVCLFTLVWPESPGDGSGNKVEIEKRRKAKGVWFGSYCLCVISLQVWNLLDWSTLSVWNSMIIIIFLISGLVDINRRFDTNKLLWIVVKIKHNSTTYDKYK